MRRSGKVGAFSLVEVVIATGIFSFAAVSILAVLPRAARQAAASRDLETAARLGDAIRLEVRPLVPAASFASFTALQLVAGRDGTGVRPLDPADNSGGQYFLIEVVPYGHAPLQFVNDRPLLVLLARVSWPYRAPGTGQFAPATAASVREQLTLVFALRP